MERHQNGMDVWVGKGILVNIFKFITKLFLFQHLALTLQQSLWLTESFLFYFNLVKSLLIDSSIPVFKFNTHLKPQSKALSSVITRTPLISNYGFLRRLTIENKLKNKLFRYYTLSRHLNFIYTLTVF